VHKLVLDFGDVVDCGGTQELRHQSLTGRRNLGPDTVKVCVTRCDDRICNGLATMAAHRLVDTIDVDIQVQVRGYRQTTMKAVADTGDSRYCSGFDGILRIISFGYGRLQLNISIFD
jgi:hypothetical protein